MTGDWLCTPAWLLVGITESVPAVLELVEQRLTLTSVEGQVFSVPLAAIERVIFPWHYFGGGAKFRVNDRVYRVSFVKPNGAEVVPARLLAMTGVGLGAGLATVVQKMVDIRDGRRVGRAWKTVLAALNS